MNIYNTLLQITENSKGFEEIMSTDTPTVTERLTHGLNVALIGMGVVFSVLIIIWIIISIFGKVFEIAGSKKHNTEDTVAAPIHEPVIQNVTETEPENDDESDGVLAVVITAAVAAALEDENKSIPSSSHNGFRVVSFRKVKTDAWKA